jgi:hypothetical protein
LHGQPKEALNLLRALAAGKSSAFAKLCAQFDSVTANGAEPAREKRRGCPPGLFSESLAWASPAEYFS